MQVPVMQSLMKGYVVYQCDVLDQGWSGYTALDNVFNLPEPHLQNRDDSVRSKGIWQAKHPAPK